MKISKFRHRSARRGFTLVEILIASSVAAVASAAMMSIFLLTSRFAGEGFTEARIVSNAAVAIEKMSRDLTTSFRQDAAVVANRPLIQDSGETIVFSIPLEDNTVSRRRFRFEDSDGTLQYEILDDSGDWVPLTQKVFLRDVDSFLVDNNGTEGFVSFVITVRVDMGSSGGAGEYSQGVKRYSMVGRVLPRNRRI